MHFIAVTNRKLCNSQEDFLQRIAILSEELETGDFILLREKDLPQKEYWQLAEQCLVICQKSKANLVFHTHLPPSIAIENSYLHTANQSMKKKIFPQIRSLSTSVHSIEEALLAEKLGADFLIAGHIFPTDCKKGLPPRGLEFLRSVYGAVTIPVYAIGGITAERIPEVLVQGAAGICVMSELMLSSDLKFTIRKLKQYK